MNITIEKSFAKFNEQISYIKWQGQNSFLFHFELYTLHKKVLYLVIFFYLFCTSSLWLCTHWLALHIRFLFLSPCVLSGYFIFFSSMFYIVTQKNKLMSWIFSPLILFHLSHKDQVHLKAFYNNGNNTAVNNVICGRKKYTREIIWINRHFSLLKQ